MVAPLVALTGRGGDGARVLIGPEAADDAGVFEVDGRAVVATTDFITPLCDDPRRFGRVAAANSISDVYAMGGKPAFALNICCFPATGVPDGVLADILRGAAEILAEAGAALLGGHTVADPELKFGLAVIGFADPARLLTLAGARPGERLILTKPLGTGVLVNAYKFDKLTAEELEPALVEMERSNGRAAELALAAGARAATDVTGFGLAGHALNIARASGVALRIELARLPVHDRFDALVEDGVTTGCTRGNQEGTRGLVRELRPLLATERELLFDPQTSGGLLISAPPNEASALVRELLAAGHRAAEIGEVLSGGPSLEVS